MNNFDITDPATLFFVILILVVLYLIFNNNREPFMSTPANSTTTDVIPKRMIDKPWCGTVAHILVNAKGTQVPVLDRDTKTPKNVVLDQNLVEELWRASDLENKCGK